jgi:hypothetical protein
VRYGLRIPVLVLNGIELSCYRLNPALVSQHLAADC